MKRLSTLLLAALAMPMSALAAPDADVVLHPPRPDLRINVPPYELSSKSFVFPTGLRIVMQPDPTTDVVGVTMWVDRGSDHDPEGKAGIAHYVEHMWFQSHPGPNMPKVWDLLSEVGAGLNASTSFDWTNYMTIAQTDSLPLLLKLESRRLTGAVDGVTEEDWLSEREVVRNELRMRYEVDATGGALRFLLEQLYPEGHPYHRMTIGTHESLSNIDFSDVQKFVADNYKPENATIAIVGNFDPEQASSLIFENFDPKLLDPKLTDADYFYYPRPGVTNPDKNNPDDWFVGAYDPATRGQKDRALLKLKDPEVRIDGPPPPLPPPPAEPYREVEAPLEKPAVYVGWVVPGAYRDDDISWLIAANMLTSAMMQKFDPGDDMLKDDRVNSDQLGCFFWGKKLASTLICYAELTSDKVDPREVAADMVDQVSMAWQTDEISAQWQERYLNLGKMQGLAQTLQSLDLISSLGGRATQIAEHAHYTGATTVHSDNMRKLMGVTMYRSRELLAQYVKRDRVAVLYAKPMPEDEVVVDTSEAEYHGATRNNDVVTTATDLKKVTPEMLKAEARKGVPNPDDFRFVTLPNGLRVVIVPHGAAPVMQATLVFRGGDKTDPAGMDAFAARFSTDARREGGPATDPLQIAGSWVDGREDDYTYEGIVGSAGNLDGALWMLREVMDTRRPYTAGKPQWIKKQRDKVEGAWKGSKSDWYKSFAWREQMFPGHPLGRTMMPEDYTAMAKWSSADIAAYMDRKFHPAHAMLIIVGDVDPEKAEADARQYFGGWRLGDAVPEPIPMLPAPPKDTPAPRILLFDLPAKSQTDVSFYCPIAPRTDDNTLAISLLSRLFDDQAWIVLRDQAGATYGAGSGAQTWHGGPAYVTMSSLVQNDAVDLAVTTFLDLMRMAKNGELNEEALQANKLELARKRALAYQSVGQLSDVLIAQAMFDDHFKAIQRTPDLLASTTMKDISNVIGTCEDHYLVVLEGPKEVVEPELKEAKVDYTVVDWKTEGEKLLEQHDPKAYAKYLKKKAKDEAKKAKKEAKDKEKADTSPES